MIHIIGKTIYKILQVFVFALGFVLNHLLLFYLLFASWSIWRVFVNNGAIAAFFLGLVFLFFLIVFLVNNHDSTSPKELVEEVSYTRRNGNKKEVITMKRYTSNDDSGTTEDENYSNNNSTQSNMWEDLEKQHNEHEEINKHR